MPVVVPTVTEDPLTGAKTVDVVAAFTAVCGYIDNSNAAIATEATTRSSADTTLTTEVETNSTAIAALATADTAHKTAFREFMQAFMASRNYASIIGLLRVEEDATLTAKLGALMVNIGA